MPSLIWINQFATLPGDGGGTRHFELARELVQRGWDVTILASDLHLHARRFMRRAGPADRSTQIEIKEGVEIRWLWAAPYEHNNWQRAWNWLSFYWSVRREARRLSRRPDVVIGSSPQIFAATAGRALARRHGVPFVFEVRDLWPESLLAVGGRRGPAYRLLDRIAKSLYRDADRVLVLARGVARYLAERGVAAEKIVHLPNGVDVQAITPVVVARTAAIAGLQPSFTLIYAGAHGPANGLDAVLDAAEILRAQSNVRFLLVGDGPAKATLREDAARRELTNVEFREPVSKYELVALLNGADAGLMVLREAPLFSFGVSPNKLFDYLSAGLPVVCNVAGEVAEMLVESAAGIQAADASGRSLAAAIRELMAKGPQQRQQQGAAGRRWVEREHSRAVLGQRLDGFLRDVLAR
jgi:glycosyltransferase involved in cell wall biosynthesis